VAEEACVTAEVMGNTVDRLFDVGVAGIHRLLGEHTRLAAARVVIVVAGMEGALPSVVGGLVKVPVIAVPTSVGYGASFGGVAALRHVEQLRGRRVGGEYRQWLRCRNDCEQNQPSLEPTCIRLHCAPSNGNESSISSVDLAVTPLGAAQLEALRPQTDPHRVANY
jgi:hypothetical protein